MRDNVDGWNEKDLHSAIITRIDAGADLSLMEDKYRPLNINER